MTKNKIDLPSEPLGTIDSNILPNVEDSWDIDYMAKLAIADINRAIAKQWNADNTIRFQSGNDNRIGHEVFHYSQEAMMETPASSERHFDHMFRVILTEGHDDGTIRVKVLGYVGYTGDAVTQISSTGKIPQKQDLDTLARLHKDVKKARELSETYNQFYFKRVNDDLSRQSVRVLPKPIATGDTMEYKQ